jgi:6-methylsalicylate decarboxylase
MAQPMTSSRIDLHAHALPSAYRDALHNGGVDRIGGIPVPAWSPTLALEFMDAHGIERQYLPRSDPGVDFLDRNAAIALARECNDELAAIAAGSERFGALAAVSLQDVDAAGAEAARALDDLRLDGIGLLSSSTDGRYLGDPRFESLLAELDRWAAWVFVHPTAVPADARPEYAIPNFIAEYPFDTTRTFISLLFNGAFDRHPAIRWQFAHGGGTLPMLGKRIDTLAAFAPLAVDVLGLPEGARELDVGSATAALERAFFDTALIADGPALLAVEAMSVTKRMVFGSDWPFAPLMYGEDNDPQPALGEVFEPVDRRRIDQDNAHDAGLTNRSAT